MIYNTVRLNLMCLDDRNASIVLALLEVLHGLHPRDQQTGSTPHEEHTPLPRFSLCILSKHVTTTASISGILTLKAKP